MHKKGRHLRWEKDYSQSRNGQVWDVWITSNKGTGTWGNLIPWEGKQTRLKEAVITSVSCCRERNKAVGKDHGI